MKYIIKRAIILLVLLCAAFPAFTEQYYGFGSGINFFTDHYPTDSYDSYTRQQIGTNAFFSFYYFPTKNSFGVFTRASIGTSSFLMEANTRESAKARRADVFEFRATASPSYRLQAGRKWQFPFSLGPTLIFTNENTSERSHEISGGSSGAIDTKYSYQAISGGLNGDIAVLFIPSKHFMMQTGVSMDYIFLRSENGEMRMNYRATHNDRFKGVPYSAFNIFIFFAMGMRN